RPSGGRHSGASAQRPWSTCHLLEAWTGASSTSGLFLMNMAPLGDYKRRPTAASLRAPDGREAIRSFLPVASGSRRRWRLLAMTVVRRTFLPDLPGRSVTAPQGEKLARTGREMRLLAQKPAEARGPHGGGTHGDSRNPPDRQLLGRGRAHRHAADLRNPGRTHLRARRGAEPRDRGHLHHGRA